jgi:hypothetical protein
MSKATRITAVIGEALAKKFTELTRQIGVSGTALLSRTISTELDYLEALPSNDERGEKGWRLLEELISKTDTRVRFNITLDRKDAERMNQICREKRIPRDGFIRGYISFLINEGDDGCDAPLVKISKILANPRHEYEQQRWISPKEEKTFWSPDGEFIERKAVCQENPYSHLHFDEEYLNPLLQFMQNRTAEK